MKKIKRLFAVLMLCVVVLSFAGCANLDEMKASHAVWKNHVQTELELNGVLYKRLEVHPTLKIWEYGEKMIYVTEADVPVLLSDQFGKRMSCSADEVLLKAYDYWSADLMLFCRADCYDAMLKQITEGPQMNKMVYTGWNYQTFELNNKQIQAVETVLKNQPISTDYDVDDEGYGVELYCSSKDYNFRDYYCRIIALDGRYCIVGPDSFLYEVPSELNDQFDQIMKKCRDEYVDV